MKPFSAWVMFLVLASVVPSTAQEPERFRYWKDVDRGASTEEEMVAFTLDNDIFAATRDGLPDLRVLDDAQAEAPCQIEPEAEYLEDRTRQRRYSQKKAA